MALFDAHMLHSATAARFEYDYLTVPFFTQSLFQTGTKRSGQVTRLTIGSGIGLLVICALAAFAQQIPTNEIAASGIRFGI